MSHKLSIMKLREYLKTINACKEALEWLEDRTVEEMVIDCPRGDWLQWIARILDIDRRKLVLTNGHCANTVKHLMKHEQTHNAVEMAIKYGEGGITDIALKNAYDDAKRVHWMIQDSTAYDASCAALDAACVAGIISASSAAFWVYLDDKQRKANQSETADICREFLGAEIIEKLNEQLK